MSSSLLSPSPLCRDLTFFPYFFFCLYGGRGDRQIMIISIDICSFIYLSIYFLIYLFVYFSIRQQTKNKRKREITQLTYKHILSEKQQLTFQLFNKQTKQIKRERSKEISTFLSYLQLFLTPSDRHLSQSPPVYLSSLFSLFLPIIFSYLLLCLPPDSLDVSVPTVIIFLSFYAFLLLCLWMLLISFFVYCD